MVLLVIDDELVAFNAQTGAQVELPLSGFTPENPTYPLTFVSARSLAAEAEISNINIDRQADRQCARVQATVTVPVEVLYTDANGVEGKATSSVTMNEDVLLYVPSPSIMRTSIPVSEM